MLVCKVAWLRSEVLTIYVIAKHFLNTAESLVVDSLEGLCTLNPQLSFDNQNKGNLPRYR